MSIFETKVEPMDRQTAKTVELSLVKDRGETKPFSVRTAMVFGEQANLHVTNYPRYDGMDVENLQPRKRGHHY